MRIHNLLASSLMLAAAASAQTAPKAAGHWEGKINIPEREFSIAVDLAPGGKGAAGQKWIGSMSVIGSTSVDVPLDALVVDGDSVKFAAQLPTRATFEGKLSADGNTIAGTATNPQGDAPFSMTRSGEAKVKIPAASSPLTKEFEGLWQGTLEVGGGNQLRLGMKLSRGENGAAIGTLISYSQGNAEIPVSTVTLKGKEVNLDVRAVSGGYRGTLGDNGEITGEWSQGGGTAPLTFKRPAN